VELISCKTSALISVSATDFEVVVATSGKLLAPSDLMKPPSSAESVSGSLSKDSSNWYATRSEHL